MFKKYQQNLYKFLTKTFFHIFLETKLQLLYFKEKRNEPKLLSDK